MSGDLLGFQLWWLVQDKVLDFEYGVYFPRHIHILLLKALKLIFQVLVLLLRNIFVVMFIALLASKTL